MRERVAKDGTATYQVMFRDGGKQRSKTFGDPKSAQTFQDTIAVLGVKRALIELDRGGDRGLTLDQLAERFFAWKEPRVRSDRTVADYRRDYTNWIAKPLGWMPAADIDEQDVQDWVDSMLGRISPKSIHDRHAILHGIFKYGSAPTRALIPIGHNPTIGTELPKKVKGQPKGFRMAEWQAFHAALTQINPDAADLAEFLLASGWRFSEAIALTTADVEDDGKYVHVSVTQVARRRADSSVRIVQDAKSVAGHRRLRLDPDASAMIRKRLQRLEAGALLFTTTQGSMWNYSHFRDRFWRKAIRIANLHRKPQIHWLRHTNVGLLNAVDASMAEMQRRIGHESITTTIDVYGGMIDDISDEQLDALAAMRRAAPKTLEAPPEHPALD